MHNIRINQPHLTQLLFEVKHALMYALKQHSGAFAIQVNSVPVVEIWHCTSIPENERAVNVIRQS